MKILNSSNKYINHLADFPQKMITLSYLLKILIMNSRQLNIEQFNKKFSSLSKMKNMITITFIGIYC